MSYIKFDTERCKGCELCVVACPQSIIRMCDELNAKGCHPAVIVDESKCTRCGLCYRMCADLAIEIEK
jgi:2-oxoglutarate ferredoxin oxidoreductase subunit delta